MLFHTQMLFRSIFYVSCIILLSICCGVNASCIPRKISSGSMVCVCNATYCDAVKVKMPQTGQVLIYTSSQNGLRFHEDIGILKHHDTVNLNKLKTKKAVIRMSAATSYQAIKGFGGALTDAASINMMSLSPNARQNLVKSYFGSEGIEYNIVRVPIASCDFSQRKYTYLDTPNDFNLTTFALAEEDIRYKIPVFKQILSSAVKPISAFASPWTAPAWMKTNHNETGYSRLLGKPGDKYHKTWAKYFTRFFDEYKKQGIKFWGVTMQNEPSNGLIVPGKWQSMGWTPEGQRDFIKTDLGPTLRETGYGDIKLMVHDDQRIFLPEWPQLILSDKKAAQFVSGIGIHWYWDWLVGPEVLNDTHNLFPDKFLLATEACNKIPPTKELGSWEDGEKYSNDILDNLNNWAVGWVDWNMCLNVQGGPNWVSNFDDSPIIVNKTADEFYKQPMYYHLGHFSKFIPEGSVRVHSESDVQTNLKFVAVSRMDGTVVLVVLNKEDSDIPIKIDAGGIEFDGVVPSRSIQTYFWKGKI